MGRNIKKIKRATEGQGHAAGGRRLTLTTGEVAAHCEVTPATVWNWVRRGQLAAATTPGGHRRVDVADFQAFLARRGMRPYRASAAEVWRVLVVDDDPLVLATVSGLFRKIGGYEGVQRRGGGIYAAPRSACGRLLSFASSSGRVATT